jgi:hypothetical protein
MNFTESGYVQGGPKVRIQYIVYKLLYTYFWPTLYNTASKEIKKVVDNDLDGRLVGYNIKVLFRISLTRIKTNMTNV